MAPLPLINGQEESKIMSEIAILAAGSARNRCCQGVKVMIAAATMTPRLLIASHKT